MRRCTNISRRVRYAFIRLDGSGTEKRSQNEVYLESPTDFNLLMPKHHFYNGLDTLKNLFPRGRMLVSLKE